MCSAHLYLIKSYKSLKKQNKSKYVKCRTAQELNKISKIMQFYYIIKTVYISYCKTCIKRSPLGQRKCGLFTTGDFLKDVEVI